MKTEGAADGLDLSETDVAKFGESNPKVTEAEGDVEVGGVDLGEEPRGVCN